MPSLLFTTLRPQHLERGTFTCPECETKRRYVRTRVRRSMGLMGRPLLSMGTGEYVECAGCLSTFRPEVLAYDAGAATATVVPEYRRAMLRVLALMTASDGVVREEEIVATQRICEAVSGTRPPRREVVREVEAAAREPTSVARYLAAIAVYLNPYGREQVLRSAALVSSADGEIHVREATLVRRLGGVLGLARERIEGILAELAEPGPGE